MGEKKKVKEGGESNKKENGGGKSNITVVLKAYLHCEGCVSDVLKCIRSFDGVEAANIGGEQKITVVGKVDPAKLREKVEKKTHKRIELVSPLPKKDDNNSERAKGKENNGADNVKQEKKEPKDKDSKDKSDQKTKKPKEKELPVTTAVLKVQLNCEGCRRKIHKIIAQTKGYKDMKIDKQKEQVTVTGAIDMKALTTELKKRFKKEVQLLPPPKKEVDKKEKGGDEKGNGGGDKGKSGGDKGKSGGGGDVSGGGDRTENKMQCRGGYPCPFVNESGPGFDPLQPNPYGLGPNYHAPQLFSDENPNACSIL